MDEAGTTSTCVRLTATSVKISCFTSWKTDSHTKCYTGRLTGFKIISQTHFLSSWNKARWKCANTLFGEQVANFVKQHISFNVVCAARPIFSFFLNQILKNIYFVSFQLMTNAYSYMALLRQINEGEDAWKCSHHVGHLQQKHIATFLYTTSTRWNADGYIWCDRLTIQKLRACGSFRSLIVMSSLSGFTLKIWSQHRQKSEIHHWLFPGSLLF